MTERMDAARNAVEFDNVNIVFGDAPQAALPLMDQGLERGPIKAETGQVLGVHNCSLAVREGEILVLMGLSGSGKSTLLRAVNGLNAVCRGEVRIWDGDRMASVTKASGAELRRLRRERIAMVFQQFGLLPWRSVRENVGLGLELAGIPAAERRKRVDAQLATVGLTEWAERKVGDLSGGMQQRVGLARAFATEAPILLMDEPFSALDPLIRNRLQDELLELQERFRRTIVFVSHDLDEAFRIGNRIALMEGGRIVQVGTAREIIANPVNAYVEDFVAHMNPLAVLTAEDMAEPGDLAGEPIDRETPVREVIQMMTETGADALALQGGGKVTRQGIMSRLVSRRGQGGGAVEH
ncbi:choline ABC transporter ATP-binding protein [Paracoccus sp. PS-1]|uniref:choline ABC transporter ATP-binding protein n=1 Tax=unclassified Paracoccus (in: a-proteobacteria) TaxID=2688777 RepID=UPI00048D9EF6|nr:MULTISPECIES: choline ABC transporter ATP-binding protein [unclassified Paracoccus (in: a-proteobacteria)]MDQ7261996.1 choline ABC transporter ATP-binding protein [Paracoccus sp. PS1]RQP06908.1 MAG: choline ABC transporter ATP-binding protein [Paracoccus sp. BP8]UFM64384.1 choline ABC transporter ATP-binding protein [Paracoccus sp. MA]